MTKPMKIRVVLEVMLADPDQWTTAFGVEGRRAIREDVKSYVANEAGGGVFSDGEVAGTVKQVG